MNNTSTNTLSDPLFSDPFTAGTGPQDPLGEILLSPLPHGQRPLAAQGHAGEGHQQASGRRQEYHVLPRGRRYTTTHTHPATPTLPHTSLITTPFSIKPQTNLSYTL